MRKNRIHRGFTLMEVIVVLVIIGILAAIAMPSYLSNFEQSNAQAAGNNLMAIAAAQSKFNEDYSSYCGTQNPPINPCYCINNFVFPVGSQPPTDCGDTPSHLIANLQLSLVTTDPFYSNANGYNCTAPINGDPAGTLYRCTATDGTDSLLLLANATGNTVTCKPAGSNCPF